MTLNWFCWSSNLDQQGDQGVSEVICPKPDYKSTSFSADIAAERQLSLSLSFKGE